MLKTLFIRRAIALPAIAVMVLAMGVHAAAPVSDLKASQRSPQVDAYYLMQSLREELRVLRGLLEEQAHEVSLLKQRQLDGYVDLDSRINALSKNRNEMGLEDGLNADAIAKHSQDAGVKPSRVSINPSTETPSGSGGVRRDDRAVYNAAYGLLKARKIDQSRSAFVSYLAEYPQGAYVANAQYWLGEIYILTNQLALAKKAFMVVIEKFPEHRKFLDASYKLGKVYHLQGERVKAQEILSSVANTKSAAGKLAQSYLKKYFNG